MVYENFDALAQALLDVVQVGILPVLGVCLATSVIFFVMQIIFSFHDFTLQFLIRLILVTCVVVFSAKTVADKYVAFTKNLYTSVPGLVR